jgi:hypothetical protein
MGKTSAAIGRGVVAGLIAGAPQVALTQFVVKPLGLPDDRADIGPRFVQQVARRLGHDLPSAQKWALAALFHFAYSAWWGGLYGAVDRLLRPPPAVAGTLLAGTIYGAAFSRWGAGTQAGSEPHPAHRPTREYLLEATAALSFSLTTALVYAWLRPGSARTARRSPSAARPARAAAPARARASR